MTKVLLVHSAKDPVRMAFAHLFTKRPGMKNNDGSKSPDKYEATFILQPGGENERRVQDAIAEVAKEKYGDEWQEHYKEFADDQKGLRKGSLKQTEGGDIYDGFEGKKYITAKNESRPGVFDIHNNPAAAEDEGAPYSGCYVHAEVDVWALKKQGVKKRIVCDLLGVRKAADGDAFSAGAPPSKSDSFANLSVADDDDGGSSSDAAPSGGAFD
ncbi:MAG: ssDNA-binding protein [Casimicrobium sp.]